MRRISLALLLSFALAACKEEEALDPAAVARGQELAVACAACHQLNGPANGVGPSLQGVVGRKAGSVAGYAYSAGMQNSGIVWTAEKLEQFLQDPFAMVPDTRMALGEMSAEEARDVVTYLRSLD